MDTLREAIAAVRAKGRYEPRVLVLSENAFLQLTNLVAVHGYSAWIASEYHKLGIERVIYADDVDDREFVLTSGRGLPAGIAEIIIKPPEAM